MLKRTIAAIAVFALMFCPTFSAGARDDGNNMGNGNGRDGRIFHESVLPTGHDDSRHKGDYDWQKIDDNSRRKTDDSRQKIDSRRKDKNEFAPVAVKENTSDNWLIYWYVCGSYDIEPVAGNMTRSIKEVEATNIGGGKVKILMQLGGTESWRHPSFQQNNGKVGRYLFDGQWHQRGSLIPINGNDPKTLMSKPECLEEFLKLGNQIEQELYPDGNVRRVFIFDDHGGGSLSGVCCDPYAKRDILDLQEMRTAFDMVSKISREDPRFEIVAFDACLMSTYETAVALEGISRYMVASQEETNTYIGFGYTDLLNRLAENPAMKSEDLANTICDTYWNDSIRSEQGKTSSTGIYSNNILTSSVVNLSEMYNVRNAYEKFGDVAKNYAKKSSNKVHVIKGFREASDSAEKYPSASANRFFESANSPARLVDLRGFAEGAGNEFPELKGASDELVAAIDRAVIHEQRGKLLKRGSGLSTYYPFALTGANANIQRYEELARDGLAPKSQGEFYKWLYENRYALPDKTSSQTGSKVNTNPRALAGSDIPADSPFNLSDFANVPVEINYSNKTASIKLDESQMDRIAGVRCRLAAFDYYTDEKSTKQIRILLLGCNSKVDANWKTGEFTSNFDGKWLTIDGRPVWTELISDSTEKDKGGNKIGGAELYAVPISLNDRDCILLLACVYPEETFQIIGACPVTDTGLPSGEFYSLNKGDVVKPMFFYVGSSEDVFNELQEKYGDPENLTAAQQEEIAKQVVGQLLQIRYGSPLTLNDYVAIEEKPLPSGNYAFAFEFVNPIGNDTIGANQRNSFTVFKVTDGKISKVMTGEDITEPEDLQD